MARRFLKMFCDFLLDNWLSSLSDTEYGTYWKINNLIHLNTDDGTAEFTWDSFTRLIGKPNQNLKVLRLLDKFHRDGRILWKNREEFIRQNVPPEIREKVGIEFSPKDSCGDSIRYRPWHWLKGGKIVSKIVCFSPQVVERLRDEMSKIRHKLRSPFSPCPCYPECKFKRSIGQHDRCSDTEVAERRLREALRGVGD